MNKLLVDLEHCYGIKKLQAEFDFATNGPVFAVYAANGVMKSSLANTFRDLAQGIPSSDRIRPENATKREIKDENGNEVVSGNIFVIEPYNQKYRSERISTLLVNDDLRNRYEDIHKDIDSKAEVLVAALKKTSGLKKEIKEEFSDAITHDKRDFFRALGRVKEEVEHESDSPLGDVNYSHIFNPKTEVILADPEFRAKVKEYLEKYDELVSHSTFFRKGVFTHNNASDIAKNLKSNGFFKAEHSVVMRVNGEKTEISSEKELEAAIQSEKDLILTDEGLKSAFESIRVWRQTKSSSQNWIILKDLDKSSGLHILSVPRNYILN